MTDPDGTPAPTSVVAELAAIRKLVSALEPLDERTRLRVLSWLADRFQAPGPPWEMSWAIGEVDAMHSGPVEEHMIVIARRLADWITNGDEP